MPRPRKNPFPEGELDWTPMDAMIWLKLMALKHKFGTNYYAECLAVVRHLVNERAQVKAEFDRQEAEIARLQKLKTPTPFDVQPKSWGD